MSSGKNPLMLMMALAMPGASQALGLGDIHVDSRLNERLVAEIDIIGATPLELADLRAAVANRDTFVRYGVDRPAFLSSATFKVTHNSQGRPVLAISSTDSFTEPLVNFLVDLRWHNGEFVREYTLLLDPPDFASEAPAVAPAGIHEAPAAKPTVESKTQTVAAVAPAADQTDSAGAERGTRTMTQIKVGARATLRGIAWRIGERSPSDLQRMMIAIFRANPAAFDGNINRLYMGAVLNIPSQADLDSISRADARSEFHSQMEAWRSSHGAARGMVAHRAPSDTATPAPVTAKTTQAAAVADEEAKALGHRIESLEQELASVRSQLDNQNHQLEDLQQQELHAAKAAPGDAAKVSGDAAKATSNDAQKAAPVDAAAVTSRAEAVPGGAAKTITGDAEAVPHDDVKAATGDAQPEALPVQAHEATGGSVSPSVKATATAAAAAIAVKAPGAPADAPATSPSSIVPAAVGLGTLGAALAALYFRLRRRKSAAQDEAETDDHLADTVIATNHVAPQLKPQPVFQNEFLAPALPEPPPKTVAPQPIPAGPSNNVGLDDQALERAIEAAAIYEATHPLLPIVSESEAYRIDESEGHRIDEPSRNDETLSLAPEPGVTVKLPLGPAARADADSTRVDTRLDYNLVDLDMTVQHVQMPSALNESPVVRERRTNLADVLKLALEREPNRDDLRMKLLELYYSAATLNRDGFLEVVQKLAQDRPNYRTSPQWEKITYMGRQILSDNPLFLDELATDEISLDESVDDVRKVS